jgi:FkbM family methyltransferase
MQGYFQKYFKALPVGQESHGFKPNIFILALRTIARVLINLLRLNGRTRWSNEFIQALDPKLTTKLSNGKYLTYRTGHGRLFWRAMEAEGDEPLMDEWITSFDGNVVFWDVGACVGTYAMRAALQGASVVAFEADVTNASLLAENLGLNNLQEKVLLMPLALDEESGKNVFFRRDGGSPGHALHSVAQPSGYLEKFEGDRVPIVTLSLDDVLQLWNLNQPTHIKIDVDHNELRILKGAENILKGISGVYIEMDTRVEEHLEIENFLSGHGFTLHKKEAEIRPFVSDWASNCLYIKR